MTRDKGLFGLVISVSTVIVLAVLVGVFAGGGARKEAQGVTISYLYSQTAASATMTGASGGSFTLTMQDVSPVTTWFTERPLRNADTLPTAQFVAGWDNLFDGDPPNAALVFGVPDVKGRDTAVVELSDPAYDEATATLTYSVIDIEAKEGSGTRWDDTPLTSFPAATGACSLFIDNTSSQTSLFENPQTYRFPGTDLKAVSKYRPTVGAEITFFDGDSQLGSTVHAKDCTYTEFDSGGLKVGIMHQLQRLMRPGFSGVAWMLVLTGNPVYKGSVLDIDSMYLGIWPEQ